MFWENNHSVLKQLLYLCGLMKKILIVDNYDSFIHNLVQWIGEYAEVCYEIHYNDHIPWERLQEFDGIILSPGPGTPQYAGDMLKLITQEKESKPIFGICLGHQALAVESGGRIEKMLQPKHGTASKPTILYRKGMWKQVPFRVRVGRYHSWTVSSQNLSQEWRITSVDKEGNILSMEHKTYPLWGVQFHPESYITKGGKQMLENWMKILRNS